MGVGIGSSRDDGGGKKTSAVREVGCTEEDEGTVLAGEGEEVRARGEEDTGSGAEDDGMLREVRRACSEDKEEEGDEKGWSGASEEEADCEGGSVLGTSAPILLTYTCTVMVSSNSA